jgi:hypothetical protein
MSGKCARRTRSSPPAVVIRIDYLSSLFALMPAEYVNSPDECRPRETHCRALRSW